MGGCFSTHFNIQYNISHRISKLVSGTCPRAERDPGIWNFNYHCRWFSLDKAGKLCLGCFVQVKVCPTDLLSCAPSSCPFAGMAHHKSQGRRMLLSSLWSSVAEFPQTSSSHPPPYFTERGDELWILHLPVTTSSL